MIKLYQLWKGVVACLVCWVGAVGFGGGCFRAEPPPVPPSVDQVVQTLMIKHPGWNWMPPGDITHRYLIAPPYPPIIRKWYVWPVLAAGKVEEIDQLPFEEEHWKNTVFVRLYQNPDGKLQGWYDHILVKGPFMFYGDQEMLKQIDKDL